MKKIAIVGGGISGLSVLHYLKKRNLKDVQITLYEKNSHVGGTIGTLDSQGFLFETGPNGFLSNQPNTLDFLKEIGFEDQIVGADPASNRRYVQINNQLHLLPSDILSLIKTPLLTMSQKLRLLQGVLITDVSKDQSVYDYTSKRFGMAVTDRFVDPFLSGVHAGDIKRLHMKSVFLKLSHRRGKAKLYSFQRGMGSLIEHLKIKYNEHIQTSADVTDLKQLNADIIICCTPAYVAAQLLKLDVLKGINYSPIAVVGLVFQKSAFKKLPDGFGYLIPSTEGKEVLGVLLESNVFKRHSNQDEIVIRVMLGGANHPHIANYSSQELIDKAIDELKQIYGLTGSALQTSIKLWIKGIPQYEMSYPAIREQINLYLEANPQIRLCSNYLDGISFNDCIYNAKCVADHLSI